MKNMKMIRLALACCASIAGLMLTGCDKADTSAGSADSGQNTEAGQSGIELHDVGDCPTGEACFLCDATLRDKGRLWCVEHDRYEDRCWICHPELEDKNRLYCSEHGIYEDECHLCHPEIKKDDKASQHSSGGGSTLMCNEHGVLERECAICQPQLASELKPGESLKIRLSSDASISKAGVGLSKPGEGSVSPHVEAYCVVDYDQTNVARVTPMVEGVIREIQVTPGQKVTTGNVLALLHSPALAELKSQFLAAAAREKLARLSYEREKRLEKVSSAHELQAAETEWNVAVVDLSAARQKLRNLDLTSTDLEELEDSGKPTSLLSLRAPFGGTIVERNAAVGELAGPGSRLFVLADLSTMWLELSVPAAEASSIKVGMPVNAAIDGIPDELITGELIWIASEIDPKTRLVRARALVKNPPAALRKGLFGQARIQIKPTSRSLTAPSESLQVIDGIPFVFVQEEPTLFAATRVQIGDDCANAGQIAILDGLRPNDRIVVSNSYIMRSEFLKSLLGAGCVDD